MAKKKTVTNCRYWNWFDLVLGATGLADLTIQLITRDSALVCPRYGSFLLDVHNWGGATRVSNTGGEMPRGYGNGDVIPGPVGVLI